VAPVQERVLKEMEARALEALKTDPQSLMRNWLNFGNEQFEQFQRFMQDAAKGGAKAR